MKKTEIKTDKLALRTNYNLEEQSDIEKGTLSWTVS